MDTSDAKVSHENGGPLEDIVQIENSNDPLNDLEWLEKIMHIEVTHGVISGDQGFSIDATHDKEALPTARVDPTEKKNFLKS